MGRYSPKEGKKRRKVTKKVLCILRLLILLCEIYMLCCLKCFLIQSWRRNEGAQSAKGERSLRYNSKAVDVACIRSCFLVRTCVRVSAHAFQQQFSFFAVTSVTVNRKRGKGSSTRFEGDNASREVVETRRR